MSLLDGIGAATASAALVLTKNAVLTRDATEYVVRASRHRSKNPARAGMTGAMIDSRIRISGTDLPVTPEQNDLIALDGRSWIIWSLEPSAAGSTIMANCTAPPTETVTTQTMQETRTAGGGRTTAAVAGSPFNAKISTASDQNAMTSENDDTVSRLVMHWPYDDEAIEAGGTVEVRGENYRIESVGINDENPTWRRALLIRSS